jgi:hypothetical protein
MSFHTNAGGLSDRAAAPKMENAESEPPFSWKKTPDDIARTGFQRIGRV